MINSWIQCHTNSVLEGGGSQKNCINDKFIVILCIFLGNNILTAFELSKLIL